ncbi:MAG: hypothetical protein Q9217_002849 [Psora testacea]
MPPVQPSNSDAALRRKLAHRFTPFTRFHHPLLDPNITDDDLPLVPKDLAPCGGLNWKLPGEAGKADGESSEAPPDTDNFLYGFQAKLCIAQQSLSQLEDFVLDWIQTSQSMAYEQNWKEAVDHQAHSTISTPTLVYSNDFDNEEIPPPIIQVTSPILETCVYELRGQIEAGEGADEIEREAKTPAGKPKERSLQKKRSFGPYELFWMKNDPYGESDKR